MAKVKCTTRQNLPDLIHLKFILQGFKQFHVIKDQTDTIFFLNLHYIVSIRVPKFRYEQRDLENGLFYHNYETFYSLISIFDEYLLLWVKNCILNLRNVLKIWRQLIHSLIFLVRKICSKNAQFSYALIKDRKMSPNSDRLFY